MLNKFLASAFSLILLFPSLAHAASRSAWTAGNGVGFTYTAVMASGDMVSLANGSTVLSGAADIANQTAKDQFMDISGSWTVASATPPAGAYIGIYLVPLNSDASTYGTGEMTSGATITRAPAAGLICTIPLETAVAITVFSGNCVNLVIPPGSFRIAVYNSSGAALSSTAGNNVLMYRTYNINLNN